MTTAAGHERQQTERKRYEAYQGWEQQQLSDPRFAGVRMLVDNLQDHEGILPETWERFDVEERTWGAEVLNAPHSHVDRFRFDGQAIIVKESDGVNPQLTLREIYQKGLEKTRAEVETEPGLAFQLRRDELFMQFYEQIEVMMRGQTEYDTIHMISTCPCPEEISDDPQKAERLLQKKFYDLERGKSFDYTARRLPGGRLELSATTLDSSNLQAHAKVLQQSGYANVNFALLQSHEYGAYLSYERTTELPIELVIARRTAVYDQELKSQTGKVHRNGRLESAEDIDAHVFFEEHCEDYWTGYRAYHELLARHVAKKERSEELLSYLLLCLDSQEEAGKSVLSEERLHRLRMQLQNGVITPDMILNCRELLVYDHHATLSGLLKQFKKTGKVDKLDFANGKEFLGAYAEAASGHGATAAANGETFAGCETATSVSSLTTAAQAAGQKGVTLEQALRMQDQEARHCLEIQFLGFTIRKNVLCPFCEKSVDAKDTQKTIECLDDTCGKVLDKATGKVGTRLIGVQKENESEVSRVRLQNHHRYEVGGQSYRRQVHIVVGGANVLYVDARGREYTGVEAERLDAVILSQLESEFRAS